MVIYRAYRPEGIVEAPTPEGLARVLKALGPIPAGARAPVPQATLSEGQPSQSPTWHERMLAEERDPTAGWEAFMSYMRGPQLEVLRVLKTAVRPMTTPDLMKALHASSPNAIAGYLAGGLFRNIKKTGLKIEAVIVIERWGGAKTYKAGPLLLSNDLPEDAVTTK